MRYGNAIQYRKLRVAACAASVFTGFLPLAARAAPLGPNPVLLTTEHVDLNIHYTPPPGGSPATATGAWSMGPRDDDHGGIEYASNAAVLSVFASAKNPNNYGSAYDFTGQPGMQGAYVLPQSQDPQLQYLGFAGYGVTPANLDKYSASTESGGRLGTSAGAWVRVALTGVTGPGKFSTFQNGTSGPVRFMVSTDGITNAYPNAGGAADDSLWIVAGGHIHYNWTFTNPGLYEVKVAPSGHFNDDGNQSTVNPNVDVGGASSFFFNVDAGNAAYATSELATAGSRPNRGSLAPSSPGITSINVGNTTNGSVTITNVADPAIELLLSLTDKTQLNALKFALTNSYLGDGDSETAFDVGTNDYLAQNVLFSSPPSGWDLALQIPNPGGSAFNFNYDYGNLLNGIAISDVGIQATLVPEPASLGFVSTAALALTLRRRRVK
jgi:surface-anchored protein